MEKNITNFDRVKECEGCKKVTKQKFIAGFSSRKDWSYYKCLECEHKNDEEVEYEDDNYERW